MTGTATRWDGGGRAWVETEAGLWLSANHGHEADLARVESCFGPLRPDRAGALAAHAADSSMAALVALVRRIRPLAHVDLVDNTYGLAFVGNSLVRTTDRLEWRMSTRWVHLDLPGDPTMRINHDGNPGRVRWTVSAQWGHRPRHEVFLVLPTVERVTRLFAEIEAWRPVVAVPAVRLGQLDLFAGLVAA